MPKVTVYVRKDDYESWKAIEEKTEFIHRALNPSFQVLNKSISEMSNRPTKVVPKPPEKIYKHIEDLEMKDIIKFSADAICKHGSSKHFCKFSKPGKPCK